MGYILNQQTGQFTGYTLDELRAMTLKFLRATDTTRYSPTGGTSDYDWIDDALNRGQEDFVRRTLCLRTFAIVELKAAYRTYRLPWNFLDFMTVYYYDSSLANGYVELIPTTIETLNDAHLDWRLKTGTPEFVYIDRVYGNTWTFGLYPIPTKDGNTISFNTEYGAVVEWVCPLYTFNQEYGVIIRMTDTDEYFLNTDAGVVAKVNTLNQNLWFEYYRLPEMLVPTTANQGTQKPEIPREYHKALVYYAASDILQSNPEDSVEFKRSVVFKQQFEAEVKIFTDKRKKPHAAQRLEARPLIWNWVPGMEFYKNLP